MAGSEGGRFALDVLAKEPGKPTEEEKDSPQRRRGRRGRKRNCSSPLPPRPLRLCGEFLDRKSGNHIAVKRHDKRLLRHVGLDLQLALDVAFLLELALEGDRM